MRREFTAISVFSMAISFVAAVVLCLQITQMKTAPEWQIAGATAWVVEVAIFGTAVYAWRSKTILSGWILGILVLVLVRLSMSSVTAFALTFVQGNDYTIALERVSALGPRVCAAFFSLMVFYPLRTLLPLRSERHPDRKRFARSEAATQDGAGSPEDADPSLLIVGGKEAIPVWENRPRRSIVISDSNSLPIFDGDGGGAIEIPLRAILPLIPRELLGESAGGYDPSHPVPIPLDVVIPQLREARIVVQVSSLYEWLPPGAMRDPSEIGAGPEAGLVVLPLELVVPRLPAEVLELPQPSPPAWAEVSDTESVLFATTPAQ